MSIRILFSVALALLWASGCGGRKMSAPGIQASHAGFPMDTLALKIFSPAQDTVLAPLLAGWPPLQSEEPLAVPQIAPDLPSAQAMLYRIQLFTSKNMAEAVSVRNEAALDFDLEARVDFETPYYKVRLGSFATPQEAEASLKRARQLGYRGAWAVRVRAPGGRN